MTYKDYLDTLDLSKNTIRAYMNDLQQFSAWFFLTNGEELSPEGFTAQDVKDYRGYLQLHRSSPATINRKLAALRLYAQMAGVTVQVKGVHEQTGGPGWLDRRQVRDLLRGLELRINGARTANQRTAAIRDQAAVVFMLNTGARVGEVCTLELSDLEITERKGQVKIRYGKNNKSRTLPLNQAARAALKPWLDIRGQEPGLVFGCQQRQLQRILADVSQLSGVDATPHTLRHTFAKSLIDSGTPINIVAQLLGHSNLNTTRIYITPGMQDLERAVSALD